MIAQKMYSIFLIEHKHSCSLRCIKKIHVSLLIYILLLLPVFIIFFMGDNHTNKVITYDPPLAIVIDAGHGGIDSGALAADGTKESDINLAISLRLRALAEFCGRDNVMTRQDDSTLSDGTTYSEHRDLQHRAEIVNGTGNCVYFSIHQNCFPTGQPSGSLVIYADGKESELLGKLTHNNLIINLNPDNRRMAEPAGNNYYVLSNVKCPAILVECGFMSNFSDMERLKNSGYQTSVALVLIASFLQYSQSTEYI